MTIPHGVTRPRSMGALEALIRDCRTIAIYLLGALINRLSVSAVQSMSASLRKRPKCCFPQSVAMCHKQTSAPSRSPR
jgi:hypothetical protein